MYLKKLDPDMDLNEYFDAGNYALLELGAVKFSTGEFIVADPLYSLPHGGTASFSECVEAGEYPITVAVHNDKKTGDRYLAAKITFSDRTAERFQLALKGNENAEELQADEIFGYPVETGLSSFCDAQTQKQFANFCNEWYQEHPEGNIYDDYFAGVFAKNYVKYPKFQREAGDWVNWELPNGDGNIVMFNSGFGDGIYPCYWGYDRAGNTCCMITQFISPAEIDE